MNLPSETLRRVDQIAADAQMTRAEVIRELLVTALADQPATEVLV